MKKKEELIFPGDESFPTPRIGYRVKFIDHLIRAFPPPSTSSFVDCFSSMGFSYIS
jgi:hypothetical protein